MHALQIWCSRATASYAGVEITDLSTSFSDGLAFCAIIHHFRPELLDFYSLDRSSSPKTAAANCALAFKVAEENLDIPALLDPEDMAEPDKFSVVTYLSQFYHLFKDEDTGCITGRTITRTTRGSESENDSLLQTSSSASSSGCSTPVGTPQGTPKAGSKKAPPVTKSPASRMVFNQAELIAKYGEEIFSCSEKKKDERKEEANQDDSSVNSLTRDLRAKARIASR